MTENLDEYIYPLPPNKIAMEPLDQREHAKLLFYNKGKIEHHKFQAIGDLLPPPTFLFFNDTKVIPARLIFRKETGGHIEVFLLKPVFPNEIQEIMTSQKTCTWHCTLGHAKRWKNSNLSRSLPKGMLEASLIDREKNWVSFSWNTNQPFSDILLTIGDTPLPPYLKRKTHAQDKERYQTVYSQWEGAVAAPTAGLHFSAEMMVELKKRNIQYDFLTLHVGAGTFKPIQVEDIRQHTMHEEEILITRNNLLNLLDPEKFIVAVGTTSLRTLESVYWYGVKLLQNPTEDFVISQSDPYQFKPIEKQKSFQAVLNHMDQNQLQKLKGYTSLYILPGYRVRTCQGLITNFHQPGSTLMVLVSSFVGKDWKNIYQEALENNYRFLSYGDSSLLLP